MKVYVVQQNEYDTEVVGVYASPEAAMAAHPALPERDITFRDGDQVQTVHTQNGWAKVGDAYWNGLDAEAAGWINEFEVK